MVASSRAAEVPLRYAQIVANVRHAEIRPVARLTSFADDNARQAAARPYFEKAPIVSTTEFATDASRRSLPNLPCVNVALVAANVSGAASNFRIRMVVFAEIAALENGSTVIARRSGVRLKKAVL